MNKSQLLLREKNLADQFDVSEVRGLGPTKTVRIFGSMAERFESTELLRNDHLGINGHQKEKCQEKCQHVVEASRTVLDHTCQEKRGSAGT